MTQIRGRGGRLVVVGAGGFGREVLDVVEAHNRAVDSNEYLELEGVVDDSPSATNLERLRTRHVSYLGDIATYLASSEPAFYVVGVGNPRVRRLVAQQFDRADWRAATLIHPTCSRGSVGSIGEGSVLCAGVQVSTNVNIGRHVHLNPSVTIGHDTVLDDFVSVNPAAVVSGEVHVESEALLGASSVILQGLSVGTGATVGASACVTRPVAPSSIIKGVPAK